jgi:hypothetical protein
MEFVDGFLQASHFDENAASRNSLRNLSDRLISSSNREVIEERKYQ